MSDTDPTPTEQSHSGAAGSGRAALIVTGVVLVLLALVPLGGGGILVGAHATQRDDDGYYASGREQVATPARAFVSDTLEIGDDGPNWVFEDGRLATLRLSASGTATNPVFVGVAPEAHVQAYLRGVDRAEITDIDLRPLSITATRHPGAAIPAAPATQRFWTEASSGAGEQSIEWPVQKGKWAVVVMNANGAPGVGTELAVGAKVGAVLWIGLAVLGVGALLLAGGIVALVAGRRTPPAAKPAAPSVSPRLVEGVH